MRIGLGVNRDFVTKAKADGIAILLGEPQGLPATSWQLDIFASTQVGEFYVGTLFTAPPAGVVAPNRLIGHAYCPGARAWKIRAVGPNPTGGLGPTVGVNVSADLHVTPAVCCFGQATGVFYAAGREILNGGAATAPMVNVRNDWTQPVLVQTVSVYSPSTNPELWAMLFDLGAGPGPPGGAQPTKGLALQLEPGQTNQLTLNPPILFTTGLWVAISTTANTLTAPGAGTDLCRIVTTVRV